MFLSPFIFRLHYATRFLDGQEVEPIDQNNCCAVVLLPPTVFTIHIEPCLSEKGPMAITCLFTVFLLSTILGKFRLIAEHPFYILYTTNNTKMAILGRRELSKMLEGLLDTPL
jgi:hypothetical protein